MENWKHCYDADQTFRNESISALDNPWEIDMTLNHETKLN